MKTGAGTLVPTLFGNKSGALVHALSSAAGIRVNSATNLIAMVVPPIHIFWFNYQNIWMVMTEGSTKKQAYTDADRYKLATAFFGVTIVALWIGVGYWRLIGAL
jgi:hypothetical protein